MSSNSERRHAERLKIQCLIRYKELPGGEERVTNVRNLSASGLMFELPHPVDLDTMVDIAINLPISSMPIAVQAKVARCSRVAKSDLYQIGVTFTILKTSDQEAISAHIDEMKEKGPQ